MSLRKNTPPNLTLLHSANVTSFSHHCTVMSFYTHHRFITMNFASSSEPNCLRRALAPNESNIRRQFNHFQLIELHPRGIGFSRYLIFCNRTSPRCGPAATHAISIYYRIAIRHIVKPDFACDLLFAFVPLPYRFLRIINVEAFRFRRVIMSDDSRRVECKLSSWRNNCTIRCSARSCARMCNAPSQHFFWHSSSLTFFFFPPPPSPLSFSLRQKTARPEVAQTRICWKAGYCEWQLAVHYSWITRLAHEGESETERKVRVGECKRDGERGGRERKKANVEWDVWEEERWEAFRSKYWNSLLASLLARDRRENVLCCIVRCLQFWRFPSHVLLFPHRPTPARHK